MIKTYKDLTNKKDVKAIYFDGTSNSIKDLQKLMSGVQSLNMNTLHTKVGLWAVRYQDGSIVWKKNKCFNNNFK